MVAFPDMDVLYPGFDVYSLQYSPVTYEWMHFLVHDSVFPNNHLRMFTNLVRKMPDLIFILTYFFDS
jgi:hypothetical protein